jgi:hypothetical protein
MDAFLAFAIAATMTTAGDQPMHQGGYPPLPRLPDDPVAVSPPQPKKPAAAPAAATPAAPATPATPKPAPPPAAPAAADAQPAPASGTPAKPATPAAAAPQAAPAPLPAAAAPQTATYAPKIEFKPLIIAPDRPGFSDSTSIAPIGHAQFELGYTYTFRDRGGVQTTTHNGPEVLARVGILDDRLEIRVGTPGHIWEHVDNGVSTTNPSGWGDVSAGIKLKLFDQKDACPRLALEAVTTMGGGGSEVSEQTVQPTVKLLASWDVGKKLTITVNGNIKYASTDRARFIQGAGSVQASYAFTDKLSLFGEYFVVGPREKGTDAAHSVDFGGSYLLDPRVQLDARIGAGINNAADNFFVGAGISVLF